MDMWFIVRCAIGVIFFVIVCNIIFSNMLENLFEATHRYLFVRLEILCWQIGSFFTY